MSKILLSLRDCSERKSPYSYLHVQSSWKQYVCRLQSIYKSCKYYTRSWFCARGLSLICPSLMTSDLSIKIHVVLAQCRSKMRNICLKLWAEFVKLAWYESFSAVRLSTLTLQNSPKSKILFHQNYHKVPLCNNNSMLCSLSSIFH